MHSVKDLLKRPALSLRRLTDQADRQQFWGAWLAEHLSPQLHGKISGITEQEGKLTIFAESAAWSARLRFAVAELDGQMRSATPGLSSIRVCVLPRR